MSDGQGRRRVVITGMGAVTPCGLDAEQTWQSVREGRSGVSAVEGFEGHVRIAAQVKDFEPERYMEHRSVRKTDRFAQFAVAAVEGDIGPIAMLVNNAGITRDDLIMRLSDEDWRSVIDTNLGGAFFTCRALSRPMLKRRAGVIVNITSIVGVHGNAGQTNYAASKAGLIGLTKSLAKELGGRGIRVNAIAPGYIATELTDALPDQAREAILGGTPLGRLGEPADVARAVRFLCSDAAGFITGDVLAVDGGLGI
jgi:3-oxoacyl-[acyl-carrier protein] reductase